MDQIAPDIADQRDRVIGAFPLIPVIDINASGPRKISCRSPSPFNRTCGLSGDAEVSAKQTPRFDRGQAVDVGLRTIVRNAATTSWRCGGSRGAPRTRRSEPNLLEMIAVAADILVSPRIDHHPMLAASIDGRDRPPRPVDRKVSSTENQRRIGRWKERTEVSTIAAARSMEAEVETMFEYMDEHGERECLVYELAGVVEKEVWGGVLDTICKYGRPEVFEFMRMRDE